MPSAANSTATVERTPHSRESVRDISLFRQPMLPDRSFSSISISVRIPQLVVRSGAGGAGIGLVWLGIGNGDKK